MIQTLQKPVLMEVKDLHGAEYNPRKMIPERLAQVVQSLAKLGFLLPIYANKNGVILSGHQRVRAATQYGYTKVPVVTIDVPDDSEKGLNVIFNKGTNDLDTYSGSAKDAFLEYVEKATTFTEGLEDIPPDTYYPCMEMEEVPISEMISLAGVEVSKGLRSAGGALLGAGVAMPVLVCEDRILNGKGRVFGYFGGGVKQVPVVRVPKEKAEYAYLALNFLSMDFDIQKSFADELRFNAFRRRSVQAQIVGLSRTWSFFVYGRTVSATKGLAEKLGIAHNKDLDLLPTASEEARKRFSDVYGEVIFDMGAGTTHDARLMQSAGFDCTPFEPYYCGEEATEPSCEETRKLVGAYLDRIEKLDGRGPDSILSSFVLNSIPHHIDRMAYLTIIAAMCKRESTLFLATQHVSKLTQELAGHLRVNNDEPNITLGNDTRFFKAQKFYQEEELRRMLEVFFVSVEIFGGRQGLFVKCKFPKRVPSRLLRNAIELEFNLPYKDGQRMGLVSRALDVFSKHTGQDLWAAPSSVVEATETEVEPS